MIKLEQDIHQGHLMNQMYQAHDWIVRTHNNLIAVGCIQTQDTGQYVNSSSPDNTFSGTPIGYRVYELNDAYSAVTPVYFRLDFQIMSGSSGAAYRFGRLTITVGFSTDGAGNIGNSNITKVLKAFATNSSGAPVFNPNARTISVKGDEFFFHGNELVAGFQGQYNIYDCGFFFILRSKLNGVVQPNAVTVIYPLPNAAFSSSTSLRYTRLTKGSGVSSENLNLFRLPRIRNNQGLLVASEADISESALLETTDRLISFRATSDDTPWVFHKLSVDDLTEKTYLHIPMSPTTSTLIPASIEKLGICALTDAAEIGVGAIGILVDE